MKTKTCQGCNKTKCASEFSPNHKNADRLNKRCRVCLRRMYEQKKLRKLMENMKLHPVIDKFLYRRVS